MKEVLWHKDFEGICPECGNEYHLGTAQNVIRVFYTPIDIELPCSHIIKTKMVTEKEGNRTCSYSQLDLYLKCPKQWSMKYLDKIRCNSKSKALEYGLCIHEVNEEFFLHKQEMNSLMNVNDVKFLYDLKFAEHDPPFDDKEERDFNYQQGEIMIDRLYNPVNEVEKIMVESEILGVEIPFELSFGDIVLIGFIDLVLKNEHGIICVDHKSGKTLFDKDKLQTNLQFPIYSMAIYEIFGEYPIESYYNFTKIHKSQKVDFNLLQINEVKNEIKKLLKKMAGSKHTAKPNFLCFWCDYSLHKMNLCNRSSDFMPKSEKNRLYKLGELYE